MNPYLELVIILLTFQWLVSSLTEFLNLRSFSVEIPEEFRDVFDAEKYSASQRYLRDNTTHNLIKETSIFLITIAFILFGGFGILTNYVQQVSDYMILQGLLFMAILIIASTLLSLPFTIYDTFVIEERYGFNKTNTRTFILDILKSLLLTIVIGAPVFSLMLWFFDRATYAWLWVWIALSVIQLFLSFIAPVVILPLFNKFTPLEDGELKEQVEDYAKAQNYRIKGIFKIDGSRRSTKGNAYFAGFGKLKRIAFFDTLIEKHGITELIAILAHEVGHCKLGHVKKRIVFSLATSLLMLFLLSYFIRQPGLYEAFQVEGTPLYAGIVFFFFIYIPLSMILGLISKAISRKHEYQADAFSAKTTGEPAEMIKALKKLSVDNLSNLTPHPTKVILEYSHPPVLQRIEALKNYKEDS